MRYARNNKILVLVFVILSIILAGLVGFVIFMESIGTKKQDPAENLSLNTTAPLKTEEITMPEETDVVLPEETTSEENLMVSTPYCNLYYPAEWKSSVRAEVESAAYGCIVTFYGSVGDREVKLFAVLFAESSDGSFPIGTIVYEDTVLDVSVELFDFEPDSSWETADADDISAMQEGVNYLIEKLEENPAFSTSEPSSSTPSGETKPAVQDLTVTTPYCVLYYPAQWKDAVRYETRQKDVGYIVVFHGTVNGKEAELFTVYFAETGDDSVPVGIYSADGISTDVSISLPNLPEGNGWTETEAELFCSLQEKVNYLIEKLKEDTAFTPV